MRKINDLSVPICIFLVLCVSACGKDEVSGPDINELLQGNNSRWEFYEKVTDTDGSTVEMTWVLFFSAPDGYRWKEFGLRDGAEDPNLAYEENGAYEVVESEPKQGTITFSPETDDSWTAAFEILTGSGDLLITKPDGTSIQYEFKRSTLGIAY